jgi:hypothetical protein
MGLTISATQIGPWDATYFGGGYTSTAGTWSLSSTGYVKLEGGFLLQWGQATTTNTTGRYSNYIYYPISFPTACLSVVMTEGGSGGWGYGAGASNNGGAATVYAPTLISTSYFYFQGAWLTGYTSYYSSYIGSNWYAVGY